MARDYYAEAHEVAERLAESNQREWSDRIAQVIEEGFTATEILIGIRFQLGELLASDALLSEDTMVLADDLRRAVEEALG